ncbi:MAG: lysine--tRNA ligase, partial [Actinobacteria bacterium]|nr:lysine--tRNA ligase [Actinomycetota bacterium]
MTATGDENLGPETPDGDAAGLARLIAGRRAKAAELRASGVDPFPRRFPNRHEIGTIRAANEALQPDTESDARVRVAGRLVARRGQGKIAFLDIQDRSGRIQLWATADRLGESTLGDLVRLDLGDILGVEGTVMRTRRGELSVAVEAFEILAKSFRPPPDKHHGLRDPETRYRQRYADLLSSPDVREVFQVRSRTISAIRGFLDERGFLEVETPVLQPVYGGAAARPFTTHHNALDREFFLRIATELYLKRLIVGGLERVYELGKDFRNEGVSFKHNPEFTMLETYEAYAGYRDVMEMLEALVAHAAGTAIGTTSVEWRGNALDLTPPWRRITLRDGLRETSGIDIAEHDTADGLRAAMRAAGYDAEAATTWPKLVDALLTQALEPTLVQPTFVYDYPVALSPLAKRCPHDDGLVERFEAFCGGMEIANAYSELNDPDDQRARFLDQLAERAAGDDEAQPMDEDYLTALEYGMPPTGGLGVGIDRLVMLLTDRASIREVVLFPA